VDSSDVVALVPILDRARRVPYTTQVPGDDPPASMRWGLYQGDNIRSAADRSYRRILEGAFLPRLQLRIESLLRGGARDNTSALYDALKAYVMLSKPEHFDAEWFGRYVRADWDASLPRDITVDSRHALEVHLDALLANRRSASPLPIDEKLIASARHSLVRIPTAQRIYERLKQGRPATFPEFTIVKEAGESAALVFKRASGTPLSKGVPGLYTHYGYEVMASAVRETASETSREEGWVLGLVNNSGDAVPPPQKVLEEDVERLYLEDYVRTWDAFIDDIRPVDMHGLPDSIQLTRVLSAPDSPLPVLMRAIVKQVTLERADRADKTGLVGRLTKLAERQLGGLSTSAIQPEQIVDAHFAGLRELVESPGGNRPAPIDQLALLMKETHAYLVLVEDAERKKIERPPSDIPNALVFQASRAPEPVRSILTALSAAAAGKHASAH
jgi:type VI secretion system protein ImpL